MAANALVQTRINGTVKAEASAVLATMGLTVSDAVRLMLIRVAQDKVARRGEGMESFDSIEALMADLNADD
jgi:DNA-damage-inducible protein J